MKDEAFIAAYNESRNGANGFFRHPLFRYFIYSDGVQECAEAGCYWLLDTLAPVSRATFARNENETLLTVVVNVVDGVAKITLYGVNDVQLAEKDDIHTDMPDGKWSFLIGNDGDGLLRMILPKEY